MSCLYKIEKDIREFLEETPKLFFNERDFQVNLALFLMKQRRRKKFGQKKERTYLF